MPKSRPPKSPLSRRTFLRRFIAAGLTLVTGAGGGVVYSSRFEPFWFRTEEVQIPLPNLPLELDGLRIVQLSDLHVGSDFPLSALARAIDITADLSPDLVVVTGDWVTYDARDAVPAARQVSRLMPALGVVSILGNHDHWTDAETVAQAVQDAGITLLRNSHLPIQVRGGRIWLAGVDDIWERHHDLDRALAGVPDGEACILLAHEPDYADEVAADGRVALQLSGHSHGGQVYLPFAGAPIVPYLGQKYTRGLYHIQDALWLYTNRGLGLIRPAIRLNCRPEITLITLRQALS